MKIAFFGLPLAACLLHRDGHQVVLACLSRDDTGGLRRVRHLLGGERVLVRPSLDRQLVARLNEERPDLIVSWFWTSKIPPAVISVARLGGFGVHPSLLPRHRGPDPTYWAIRQGDSETGVTAHRLAEEYDTGAILGRESLSIDPGWNALRLARALDRPSLRMLRALTRRFSEGEAVAHEEQNELDATSAPFPTEDEQEIRWSASTEDILRQVRALSPAPGAVTEIHGKSLVVLEAVPAPSPTTLEAAGEAIWSGDRMLIRTGDGAIAVLLAEVDGMPMRAEELRHLL